jgi:hypothetical protein
VCLDSLFPEKPTVEFYPAVSTCCGFPLHVQKTRAGRKVATMDIGTFIAREVILKCRKCGCVYTSEELQGLVPAWCNFGYDVLVFIGRSFFIEHHDEKTIQLNLKKNNVVISPSEIRYLAKKFIVYQALTHRESSSKLKEMIQSRGGYILHVDSMCEGNSPHLMSGLDELSKIVMGNVKLPTEKADKIIPFFEKLKTTFGNPLAIVSDMSKAILNAAKQVFKNIQNFICHYHFLRDIGKDLFGKENDTLRNRLKYHGIQGLLLSQAAHNKNGVDKYPELINNFVAAMEEATEQESTMKDNSVVGELAPVGMDKEATDNIIFNKRSAQAAAYTMIQWAVNGKKEGNGYGFPFDRPYLNFYQRLKSLYSISERLQKISLPDCMKSKHPFYKIYDVLENTLKDKKLLAAVALMQEKIPVFDRLRDAMRIAPPTGKAGLNDDGKDADIKTIEKGVEEFRQWLVNKDCFKENKSYQKMIEQIDKYWKQLFADPIIVNTSWGKITIQPQRTNNILERFFRSIRYGYRRKSGKNSLSKTLKAMLADTPLVKNLNNPEYLKIILNGKTTLEERFAEIDAKIVRQELKKSEEYFGRIPAKIKVLIKKPNLPEMILNLFAKQLAA